MPGRDLELLVVVDGRELLERALRRPRRVERLVEIDLDARRLARGARPRGRAASAGRSRRRVRRRRRRDRSSRTSLGASSPARARRRRPRRPAARRSARIGGRPHRRLGLGGQVEGRLVRLALLRGRPRRPRRGGAAPSAPRASRTPPGAGRSRAGRARASSPVPRGRVDRAREALVDDVRDQPAVVEVGVGQEDRVEGRRVEAERHAVADRLIRAALEHPAVDEDPGASVTSRNWEPVTVVAPPRKWISIGASCHATGAARRSAERRSRRRCRKLGAARRHTPNGPDRASRLHGAAAGAVDGRGHGRKHAPPHKSAAVRSIPRACSRRWRRDLANSVVHGRIRDGEAARAYPDFADPTSPKRLQSWSEGAVVRCRGTQGAAGWTSKSSSSVRSGRSSASSAGCSWGCTSSAGRRSGRPRGGPGRRTSSSPRTISTCYMGLSTGRSAPLTRTSFDRLLPELAAWLPIEELQSVSLAYMSQAGYDQAATRPTSREVRRRSLLAIHEAHRTAVRQLRARRSRQPRSPGSTESLRPDQLRS